MRLTMQFMILTIVVFVLGGCISQKPSATIDEIERSGKLTCIERITLNKDDSVTLIAGKCPHLTMLDTSGKVANSANLMVGQECQLSDFRHVTLTYKLKGIKENKLVFWVVDSFNAISFGDGVKLRRKTVTILPYEEQADLKE